MKKHHSISPEVKEQILQRIKNEGVPVSQAAKEHGLHESTIYAWLSKGLKSIPTMSELVRLKRQNEELLALVGELTLKMSQAQKKS
jgi:transposase-like protein